MWLHFSKHSITAVSPYPGAVLVPAVPADPSPGLVEEHGDRDADAVSVPCAGFKQTVQEWCVAE